MGIERGSGLQWLQDGGDRRAGRDGGATATRRVFLSGFVLLSGLPAALRAHGSGAHDGGAGAKAGVPAAPAEQKEWGIAGDRAAVRRTIEIRMLDTMRFVPDLIRAREGETVRLRVVNRGRVMHELVLGTRAELDAHAALMQRFPGMEHDEAHMAHVAAGRSGALIWHFNRAGDFEFACLIPGHYEAGMRGTVRVEPREGRST